MKYAVYGTVYNSASTVQQSIESIFSSEYEISIVDAWSNDGTYEILAQLRQDYNLKLSRQKCSRGKGRDLALRMCPDGSRTAYVDLDSIYTESFHKLMASDIDGLFSCSDQWTLFAMKDRAMAIGGWHDLNIYEDLEFITRYGVQATAPAIIGFNRRVPDINRELRYTGNTLPYRLRMLRNKIDMLRGNGMKLSDISTAPLRWRFSLYPLYPVAALRGIYRNGGSLENWRYLERMMLQTLINPEDLGVPKSWILFPYYSRGVPPDDQVRSAWGKAYKIACREMYWWASSPSVIYVKDLSALDNLPKISYLLGSECFEKL